MCHPELVEGSLSFFPCDQRIQTEPEPCSWDSGFPPHPALPHSREHGAGLSPKERGRVTFQFGFRLDPWGEAGAKAHSWLWRWRRVRGPVHGIVPAEILLPRLRDQNDKALELGDRVQMRMAPPSNHSTKKLQPGRLFANNQELALHEIPNRPCNPKVLYRKVPGYRWTEIVGGI